MLILGIETSCDETAVALYHSQSGLIDHTVYSQIALHADYGGVVPELASRDHIKKLFPLVDELLIRNQLSKHQLEGIAYTEGPGLIGALMVGTCWGRSLAYALNIPAIGVHHMEGHLLAPMLENNPPTFPFLALLVSGGHTQLVEVKALGDYQLLGESVDDAAGEAFDKVAKMLDLDYPGGPAIAQLALKGKPGRFNFPRPMTDKPGFNFSFSGLKTATLHAVNQHKNTSGLPDESTCADIAYAFEEAAIDTLTIKCVRALKHTGLKQLVIAGGVSANTHLRSELTQRLANIQAKVFYARPEFCTDNAAMIAYAGCQRLLNGQTSGLSIKSRARWPLSDLSSLNIPPTEA